MKAMSLIFSAFLILTLVFSTPHTRAGTTANTSATATAEVIASIGIARVSDLIFGKATQGDPAQTVAAGTTDNASNASFTVTGQPNYAYTVVLPTTITMTTAGGGANKTIAVDQFTSYPNSGLNNGVIGPSGSQLLLVGATRAAISPNQVAGSYSGTFTVVVNY